MQAHTILASLLLIALSHAQSNEATGNNKPLTRVDVQPSACTTTTVLQPREETPSKKKRQLKPLDLLCGKNAPCGSAVVDVSGDQLTLSVSSAAGWTIGKIHVFVGIGWPLAWNASAPPPGAFPIEVDAPALPFQRSFTVGQGLLSNVCGAGQAGGQIAVAIHTESQQSGGSEETGWVKGNNAFAGARWGWFQSICVPCTPGQSVPATAPATGPATAPATGPASVPATAPATGPASPATGPASVPQSTMKQPTPKSNGDGNSKTDSETSTGPATGPASVPQSTTKPKSNGGGNSETDDEVAVETVKGKDAANAFKPTEVVANNKCTFGNPTVPREENNSDVPARKRALTVSADILCGQKTKCGTTQISVADDGTVSVTVSEAGGFSIAHLHIFAAPGWPTAWSTKAPPPGQFPVNEAFVGSSVTKTFKIGEGVLANVCGAALATGGQLAIAVHVDAAPTAGGSSETGWSKGNVVFGGARWGWWHSICVPCQQQTKPVDVSDVQLEAAAAVPDPVEGSQAKKLDEFKKTAKTPAGKSVALSAKVNSVTAQTARGVDTAVRVVQSTLDAKLPAGVKATVTKGDDDVIKVVVESTTDAQVSEATQNEVASLLASFALVESVEAAPVENAAKTMVASATSNGLAVAALIVVSALNL